MRFKINSKQSPRLNDKKTVIRFAYLPTKIDDYWIWLEYYKVKLIFNYNYSTFGEYSAKWFLLEKKLINKSK